MGIIGKAIEWMGDHKLITFLGAAGAGALVFSKTANANPSLPGAKGVSALPGGGLVSANAVIPPPNPSTSPMKILQVTTQDPAPYGNLNARATNAHNGAAPSGAIIGYWPKNGLVSLLDPGIGNGMMWVEGPGIDSNGNNVKLKGWAFTDYLVALKDEIPLRF